MQELSVALDPGLEIVEIFGRWYYIYIYIYNMGPYLTLYLYLNSVYKYILLYYYIIYSDRQRVTEKRLVATATHSWLLCIHSATLRVHFVQHSTTPHMSLNCLWFFYYIPPIQITYTTTALLALSGINLDSITRVCLLKNSTVTFFLFSTNDVVEYIPDVGIRYWNMDWTLSPDEEIEKLCDKAHELIHNFILSQEGKVFLPDEKAMMFA